MADKIRWIAQKNLYSCGPVAILNTLKWLGSRVSYEKNYGFWKKKCRCTLDGTHQHYFQRCLDTIKNALVVPKNLPTMACIEESLRQDKLVIMKSSFMMDNRKVEGHFFIVSEMTEDRFFLVNVAGRHTWLTKLEFAQRYLQYHRMFCDFCGTSNFCGVSPYAWLIKRQNS